MRTNQVPELELARMVGEADAIGMADYGVVADHTPSTFSPKAS